MLKSGKVNPMSYRMPKLFPCSVTFGPGDSYSFTSGKFAAIGQNESFSNARVNMTNYEYSKRCAFPRSAIHCPLLL